ncbi:MAG TPA: thiol-activated cytolysin family protein [Kofleriaceae bacterium]|nr:thiol-activated cytolysin family protein [Kofleriaceae bacterium]
MKLASASLLLAIVTGCSTELVAPETGAIDEYVKALPYLPVQNPVVEQGARSAAARDGDYSCTTQNLRETRQYDRIVAYAANSDSLWPGALVAGDSLYSGLFSQIVMPRRPMTISVSLENLAGTKKATVAEPSLSAYREALSDIVSKTITGSTAANIFSEIEEVHTEQQLGLALGVSVGWALGTASLKSSFDFSKRDTRSRFVVRFTQGYYTVDLDAPESPSAMLAQNVPLTAVQEKMNDTNPPLYVSSITYGRMVVFTFESEYSADEMAAALEFAYSGGVDVSGDVSVTYKDIISRSKITAFILGGSGGDATQTINSYEALIAFIKNGGDYSAASPGAPIAYKLNYLRDNSPARMSFTTDYSVKECSRVAQKVKVTLKSITVESAGGDSGDDLELYGTVSALGTSAATLFNKGSSTAVTIRQGETFPNGAFVNEAIIDVTPAAGSTIRLSANIWDADGFLNGDDLIGNELVLNPFETGWRRERTMILTGSDARVQLLFGLEPI